MKKNFIFTAILALALTLGLGSTTTEGARWERIAIADSLDLTTILGDTVIQIVDWPLTQDVGEVTYLIRELGITTTSTEATYNFETVLREVDAESDTVQIHYYESSTAKNVACDLLGTSDIWGSLGEKLGIYLGRTRTFGGKIILRITKNDCDAGYVDIYIWRKAE